MREAQYEFEYEVGSGNVFANLELEDAEQLLLRARLGSHILRILQDRGLKKHKEIQSVLDIGQAEASKLMNGKYHLFSEGRLLGFLGKLDRKITITITPRHSQEEARQVVFP